MRRKLADGTGRPGPAAPCVSRFRQIFPVRCDAFHRPRKACDASRVHVKTKLVALPGQVTEAALLELATHQASEHALITLDRDARIVGWHMSAAELFGYSAHEIAGQPLDVLFVPEDRERGEPAHEREVALKLGSAEDDRWSLRKD